MNILKILIIFLLILVTSLSYGESAKIFYTNVDALYLVKLSSINAIIAFMFILIFAIILFYKFSSKSLKIGLLSVVFLFWLLSGTRVSINRFMSGRVSYGIYCFEISHFFLCDKNDMECESTIFNTKVESLSLWRVKIKNQNIEKKVFIGPINWDNAMSILKMKNEVLSSP